MLAQQEQFARALDYVQQDFGLANTEVSLRVVTWRQRTPGTIEVCVGIGAAAYTWVRIAEDGRAEQVEGRLWAEQRGGLEQATNHSHQHSEIDGLG
jgi:hypothetical protein